MTLIVLAVILNLSVVGENGRSTSIQKCTIYNNGIKFLLRKSKDVSVDGKYHPFILKVHHSNGNENIITRHSKLTSL